MNCPKCHAEIPENKVLCPICGEFLLADIYDETIQPQKPEEAVFSKKIDPKHFHIHLEDEVDLPPASVLPAEEKSAAATELSQLFDPYEEKQTANESFPELSKPKFTDRISEKAPKAYSFDAQMEERPLKRFPKQKPKREADASPKPQKVKKKPKPQPEETPQKPQKRGCGCGCGCFTVLLVLIVLFVVGIILLVQVIGTDTVIDYLNYFAETKNSVRVLLPLFL